MNKILTTLVILSIPFFVSCTKDGGEDDKNLSADNTVVKLSFNRTKVLKNPLCGWVMYASRDSDASYWDTSFYIDSEGKTVKVRDYASACYIRTSWASLNPSEDHYAWQDPTSNLYKLIQGARERNLPISFRVVVDGRDQGQNTPQFVYDAGAAYGVENVKYPTRTTPMPQDPVFQKYYEKFVKAFAAEFDDPDRVAFIDAYGLGKWGEGHTVAYNKDDLTAVDANTTQVKKEVMEWITKLYSTYFKKVPLVINYHRSLGHPTGGTQPDSNDLVAIAVSNGYSLRSDAFGMNDYYGTWEKACVNTYRYQRPVIMEGGWIVSQHSYWNDPAGYRKGYPEDVRQGEYDASKEAKVNMMDFRVGDETRSWFENAFDLVKKFEAEGGYRIYPDQVGVPAEVKSGSEVTLESRWRNMGWGYLPNNIPQWNYKYKGAYALLDKSDEAVAVYVDDACEPSEWVDSKANSYTFKTNVSVPSGTYTWAIGIVDKTKNNVPGINLAVNDDITAGGWVKLLEVKVD